MELRDFLLAIFKVLPDKKIAGKKRLQKIVHLMKEAGANVDVNDFRILHFGPFSYEVADCVDKLSIYGPLQENFEMVNIGSHEALQYVYKLEDDLDSIPELAIEQKKLVCDLNNFSTTVLEVASTISFFISQGDLHDRAVERTKHLKPTKTVGPVLQRSDEVFELIGSMKN